VQSRINHLAYRVNCAGATIKNHGKTGKKCDKVQNCAGDLGL